MKEEKRKNLKKKKSLKSLTYKKCKVLFTLFVLFCIINYEELGDVDSAIAQYEKTIANEECMFVPHALFSLGRIAEEKGDFETAVAKYDELVSKYASSEWANLAESRLIALEIDGKAL